MSGLKETTITYDPRGELIIKIRSTKEDSFKRVKFVETQIQDLSNRIKTTKSSLKNTNLTASLITCADNLDSNIGDLNKRKSIIENYPVNTGASEGGLKKDDNKISKEHQYIQDIANSVENLNRQVTDVVEADNIISELGVDFNKIENLIKNNGSLLREWTPKDYEDVVKNTDTLKKSFDKYMTDIDSGKMDISEISLIKDIYKGVRNYTGKLESLITDYTIKDNELKNLKKHLDQLRQDIGEQIISSKDSIIKNILKDYLNRLRTEQIEIEKKRYEEADERLNVISNKLPLLKKVDEMNFNIETEMSRIEALFKENDAILRKWVIKDYESYLKNKEEINVKLNGYKKELQDGKTIDTTQLSSIFEQTKILSDKVDLSRSISVKKNKDHQKRLYVIKSLREVCASLGFDEINEPYYEQEGNAYTAVSQDFDTLIYGTLTFTVSLDGKIESSSGISIDKCGDKFSEVSNQLKEQYGIETSFKRVEDGEPIKRTRTAKDLPKSSATIYKSKGGS